MVKKMLVLWHCPGFLFACTKADKNPQPATGYPVTPGKYQVTFDSVKYQIDSMQVIYNDTTGVKTVARMYNSYSWESPVIQYRENDSAFAQVTAWGRFRTVTAFLPRMEFTSVRNDSADFHSDVLKETTADGKNAFIIGRHERY